MKWQRKAVDAYVTNIDESEGLVTAIFSVFGNVDSGGDKTWPGAFTKTFAERGSKVLVLDNHRYESTGDTIGKPVKLREVPRDELPPEVIKAFPDALGGAEITVKFEPDPAKDARSAAVFYRLSKDWIREWSFGYDALDFDFETVGDNTIRNLRTIKLYEVSPVLWGMNEATTTTNAKGMKLADFATQLSNNQIEAELWDQRWQIFDTLHEVLFSTLRADNTDFPLDQKIEIIDRSLAQFSAALLEWAGRAMAADAALQGELFKNWHPPADPPKDDEPETETKAGAVLNKANKAKLQAAAAAINEVLASAETMGADSNVDNGPDGKSTNAPTDSDDQTDSAGPPDDDSPKTNHSILRLQIATQKLKLLEVY